MARTEYEEAVLAGAVYYDAPAVHVYTARHSAGPAGPGTAGAVNGTTGLVGVSRLSGSKVDEALTVYAVTAALVQDAAADLAAVSARFAIIEQSPGHPGQARLASARAAQSMASHAIARADEAVLSLARSYPRHREVIKLRARLRTMRGELERLTILQRELGGRPKAAPHRLYMPAIADVAGSDQRPDPIGAETWPAFMAKLRRYRQWAGDISFREMAQRAGNTVAASTLCTALNKDARPRLEIVTAVVTGCGGGEEDLQRFATAWRGIRLAPGKAPGNVRQLRTVPPPG